MKSDIDFDGEMDQFTDSAETALRRMLIVGVILTVLQVVLAIGFIAATVWVLLTLLSHFGVLLV